jgi:alpha-beta hydrolase superfamily lysophospholipase
MTEDLRTVTALVRAKFPHATIVVAGESLGGAVAIEAFASDRPPAADRLVLLAPAVWGWSTQPVAYKTALAVAARLFPHSVLTPPSIVTDNIAASDNLEELEAMGRDPLMIWGARVDALYGLVGTMQHASEQIGEVKGPVLYLAGDHDQVITRGPAMAAVRRLPPGARTGDYADGWHLLMRDKEGPKVWADVAAFIRDPTAPLPSGVPPIHPLDGAAASR